jgi:hypothetical protein
MNKRTLFAIVLALITIKVFPQLIDNKINIYIGYNSGLYFGNESVKASGFHYPSLFSNYNNLNELSFKMLEKRKNIYSIGLGLKALASSGWEDEESTLYNDSKILQFSMSPIIQIHTKYAESHIFNRLKIFFEIAPVIGLSEITLGHPLFDIQGLNGSVPWLSNSREIFYGINGDAGIELSITGSLGVYLSCSGQLSRINPKLYNDRIFSYSCIGSGLILRFQKNKRFYY